MQISIGGSIYVPGSFGDGGKNCGGIATVAEINGPSVVVSQHPNTKYFISYLLERQCQWKIKYGKRKACRRS